MYANPLKTTTAEIYRGWQEELSQLQRRWNEIKANAQAERGEATDEAEGLRLRMQALRDLMTEAVVVEGDPASWRNEVPSVRLGSVVRIEFDDGGTDDFLFIGLAGPNTEGNVLTPRTPLGTAILGHKVGESVSYHVGSTQFRAVVRRCLVPDGPSAGGGRTGGGARLLEGADEEDEAVKVAGVIQDLLREGMPAAEIVVAWRAPYQSGAFETCFVQRDLHYRLEGADGFYDQPTVSGITALLRLLANPADGAALFQTMRAYTHAPAEALERLAAAWTGPDQTVLPASLAKDKSITHLLQALYKVWPRAASLSPEKALAELGERLQKLRPEFFGDRFQAPWPAMMAAVRAHDTIRGFLAQADQVAAKSRRGARDGIVLTPLAQLGGREFTALILVGANEGAVPLLKHGDDDLPAERELFYGALTAAKSAAVSWSRTVGGQKAERSRFIGEIMG